MNRFSSLLLLLLAAGVIAATSCMSSGAARLASGDATIGAPLGSRAHAATVMTSKFCGTCHPAIYAEHAENTHGRAFTDEEARLATGHFDQEDCIRCHTPRPIFETGIGQNPQRRWYGLEDGNSCMTCHWKQGADYANFVGGAECKTAFDDRVGTVEACATCHRNHGTPYQWEKAPNGKLAGKTCISCHMKQIERPVAVGGPVRRVRSHVFPGCRDVEHVSRAYTYDARIEGNEVKVTIHNDGAGHNFPTELKQRAVESLIVVHDADGKEVSRSRMVFRDPYKRPYGLHLQVNSQIPSGESRTHTVPLKVAGGTVTCELHFKYYYPIEDNDPDQARRLEQRKLAFAGVTPSDKPVESDPEVKVLTPEHVSAKAAGMANLVDYAHPPIAGTELDVPTGTTKEDIQQLIEMFKFPVPEGNRLARTRLVEIGEPAIPQLITALGSWDNKTFNQAIATLRMIGGPAEAPVRAALQSDELYIRIHARKLIPLMRLPDDLDVLITEIVPGLSMPNPLDRASAAELLAKIGGRKISGAIMPLLDDTDPDVVRAAAQAMAAVGEVNAVTAITAAMRVAPFVETRMDLAATLGELGSAAGITVLLDGLDLDDDLLREDAWELFYPLTGQHFGYQPTAPRPERLAALSALRSWWSAKGDASALLRVHHPSAEADEQAWKMVATMGGTACDLPAAKDVDAAVEALVTMGKDAIPALLRGMKFPPGFSQKRALVLTALYRIADKGAAPAACEALRDPVLGVAAYAALTLETCGDVECVPALRRYTARLESTAAQGLLPASIPDIDPLLSQAARTRLLIGDRSAKHELANLLLSDNAVARQQAIDTLSEVFGGTKGYDPSADKAERHAAAKPWLVD